MDIITSLWMQHRILDYLYTMRKMYTVKTLIKLEYYLIQKNKISKINFQQCSKFSNELLKLECKLRHKYEHFEINCSEE